jgi:hypothetical protein
MEMEQQLAHDILRTLEIGSHVRKLRIDQVNSPWNERVEIKKKGTLLDVKLSLWDHPLSLYGRLYRLLMYVGDVLQPEFQYDPERVPNNSTEPAIRETYNHLWGIYIDSRVERRGIDNFYDWLLRRNLFIDAQKNISWQESSRIFQRFWGRECWTHRQIVEEAYHLNEVLTKGGSNSTDAFEVEIAASRIDDSVQTHIDRIASSALREKAEDVIRFAKDHCRGTLVDSSSYGLYFMYDQEIFAEMITTRSDALLISVFDFQLDFQECYRVTEASDSEPILEKMRDTHNRISSHLRLKSINNPTPTF